MKHYLLAALLIALVTGAVLLFRPRPAPPPSAPPERPVPSRYDAAIDAALRYLADEAAPSWQVYALLDYLRRRFDLDKRHAMEYTFRPERHPAYDLELVPLMGRLVDSGHRVPCEMIDREDNELTRAMARALYCDQCAVDKDELVAWMALFEKGGLEGLGGYVKTHVVLCFQWLRELGCDRAFVEFQAPWDRFADTLAAIADHGGASTDLAFEAMAFLYYIGRGDLVRDAWVDALLGLQESSGGWAYRPGDGPHGHPTVLALWVLLERARPRREPIPWLE